MFVHKYINDPCLRNIPSSVDILQVKYVVCMFSELSYILPFLLVSTMLNPVFAALETLGTYDCKRMIIS